MASIRRLKKFTKSGMITLDVQNFIVFADYISQDKVL